MNQMTNINVRVFYSIAEIQAEEGFKHDAPVTKDTYKSLIGDYNLPEMEAKCCYQKENGNLCATDHKRGLVVRVVDGSVSIVGNCCGKTKLGQEAKRAILRYENEQKRLEKIKALNDLIDTKDQRIAALSDAKADLKSLSASIDQFLSSLGVSTRQAMESMAKTGSSDVSCKGITLKEYIDEDGKKQIDRRVIRLRIGGFSEISILNKSGLQSIRSEIVAIEKAFLEAEKTSPDSKASVIDKLVATISNGGRIPQKIDELKGRFDRFLKNDFSLLCFISSNKVERLGNAKFAMQRLGLESSKDKARVWMKEKESEIQKANKVDKLEIG